MDSNRKYLGMTIPQLGILVGLAGALLLILCVAGWLIFGGGLSSASPQPIPTTAVPTVTLIVTPTITPTPAPTAIPYEQLIPQGWKQYRTSLVEIWLPAAFKETKSLPKGLAMAAVPELILSQPASKTVQYARSIVISYEPLTTDSLDSFLDLKIQSLPSPARVTGRNNDLLNTTAVIKVSIETRVDTLDMNELLYVFQDGGTVWYVAFFTQINEFYANVEMFEKSALTFRLVK
jgi:hypothetical protein